MFQYSIGFFALALVAMFFGFSGVAQSSAAIAKLLFYGFLALTALSLVTGMVRGNKKIS